MCAYNLQSVKCHLACFLIRCIYLLIKKLQDLIEHYIYSHVFQHIVYTHTVISPAAEAEVPPHPAL